LQDEKIYGIDKPYHGEQMAPLAVRKVAPPSTISKGARLHREKEPP